MSRYALVLLAGGLFTGAWLAPQPHQQSVFRSEVNVVSVPVTVMNGNTPVRGLTSSDFRLLDNGVAQHVTSVTVESLAVDVTLVLDTSASVEGRLLDEFKADIQAISDLSRPNDRVRLLTFGTSVSQPFSFKPGDALVPIDQIRPAGPTPFYDGLAAALILAEHVDRPSLIFAFSDGFDNVSLLDANRIRMLAGYSNAALYLTLTPPVDSAPSSATMVPTALTPFGGGPDVAVLREAVARTGGVMYQTGDALLPAVFQKALDDFRTAYVLTYTLQGVPRPGWHAITAQTTSGRYTIRARTGYEGG
jgi:VWFA-related protein